MNEIVRKDALQILDKTISILRVKEEKNVIKLRNLSNHTIHNASVFQDDCSVSIAVVIYALSKIIERKQNILNYKHSIKHLEKARKSLKNDELHNFERAMRRLLAEISRVDLKLELYITEVIKEAQIKKGCKLCEHGLSTAKASEVIGVSQWDLMGYLGNTQIKDDTKSVDVRTRLKLARGLFS